MVADSSLTGGPGGHPGLRPELDFFSGGWLANESQTSLLFIATYHRRKHDCLERATISPIPKNTQRYQDEWRVDCGIGGDDCKCLQFEWAGDMKF